MKVLIICAMTEETEEENQLKKFFNNTSEVKILKSGIGIINSTLETTKEIISNKPDIVFNVGCSGAHCEHLKINDIVVGTECIPISNVIINDVNNIKNYGFRESNEMFIRSDENLLRIARNRSLKFKDSNVQFGAIASSDIWINNLDLVKIIHKKFNTLCEEMESVSIAKVCQYFNIPFLAIKDISNSVFTSNQNDFDPELHEVPENVGYYASKFCHAVYRELNNDIVL